MKKIALYFGPNLRENDAKSYKAIKDFYKEITSVGIPKDTEMIISGFDCDQLLIVPDEYAQKVIDIANRTKGLCAKINLTD